ncbi:DUF1919 domain-containing protein [Ferruginibacter paludis]|uniref:DUF1919 domain-containing protein n=1 Tax=Ferruginibacter paludis TaxID=1310417 RepID=UPI0025B2BF67|nr:DUF1919 domain-containing protein [Ferruginibacter paludis]MDN3655869.1 DUF1919 domain-containing protein [Ferruginibacter paludis]
MKFGFYRRAIIHQINAVRESFYLKRIRRNIRNKNFTIISNNCWGGSIYEDLSIPYTSPTIGLFFFAPCYIRFISALRENLNAELEFVKQSKYEKGNYLQTLNAYPIGLLNKEIEIHFLHYQSEAEAMEKWNRRVSRVNFDNLFFSFSDNEECGIDEIEAFDQLPGKKVFFSAKKILGIKSLIFIKSFRKQQVVGDMYDNRWHHRQYFDVVNWLNSGV